MTAKKRNLSALLTIALILMAFFAFMSVRASRNQDAKNPPPTPQAPASEKRINYDLTVKDPAVQRKLAENGFVVIPGKRFEKLHDLYISCKEDKTPIIVTSDALLHTSHLIFDWYLRYLEIAHLRGDLISLTDALIAKSYEYYELLGEGKLKEAALKNAIYFTIAKQLLTKGELRELPEEVTKIIEEETRLIEQHNGFSESPLMGYREDYSQYRPRGHYERSPEFQSYFKAMSWYGRISFPIEKDGATLQALLLCKALNETEIKGEPAARVWRRIYESTGFFCGKSDDLTQDDYLKAINRIYGENVSLEAFTGVEKLRQFKEEIKAHREPRILSAESIGAGIEGRDGSAIGLRFMGQRFNFDSYVFQNLIFDRVKEYMGKPPYPFTAVNAGSVHIRGFSRGLDLLAVLGSPDAYAILESGKDTDFNGYGEQIGRMKKEFGNLSGQDDDLYNGRLLLLKNIVEKPHKSAPSFMQTKPWLYRQINTALGSWTELKHDSILYTKQPYAEAQRALSALKKGGGPAPTPEVVKGYVEPCVEVYRELGILFEKLKSNLTELSFPEDSGLRYNIERFTQLLKNLEEISRKELAGNTLTAEEYNCIENIGSTIRSSLSYGHYYDVTSNFTSEEDDLMPIAADVLTEPNSRQVLIEAIGPPFVLIAEVNVDNEKKLCHGAVYSCFEFKWPMSDRLTDTQWRKLLQESREPAPQGWSGEFMIWEN